jgi:tRNA (pseudouridine54-N1)-methyltransferase
MRTFFVVGHTQAPTPEGIRLEDLPGASGRWDVLARCVTASLLVSHGVRQDAEAVLYLVRGGRYVRIVGSEVRNLNPDERSTAAIVAKALGAEPVGVHEENPLPGFYVGQGGFDEVVDRVAGERRVVWLHEAGDDRGAEWSGDAVFVVSDHREYSAAEASALEARRAPKRSLGPEVWQADQAIVLVHDRLNRYAHSRP